MKMQLTGTAMALAFLVATAGPASAQTGQTQTGQAQAGESDARGQVVDQGAPLGVAPGSPEARAFEQAFRGMLPLTPEMIRSARRQMDAGQRAASLPPGPELKPALTSQTISLEPGVEPPVLELAPGRASVLTFFDQTGAAWPIEAYVSGNPNQFDVLAPIEGGSSLTVTPLTAYPVSNLVVFLSGEDVPIMFEIRAGTTSVDYRRNINVNGLGPNAVPTIIQTAAMPVNGDADLMRFLDGVPPEGARRVEVLGGEASAWRWNGDLYLRTALTLVSPSWISSVRSAGGMQVYRLSDTPVLIASVDGNPVELVVR